MVNEKQTAEFVFETAAAMAEKFGLTRAEDNNIALDDLEHGDAIVIAQPTGIIAGNVRKDFAGDDSNSDMEAIWVSRRFIRTVYKPYTKNRAVTLYLDEGAVIYT